MAKINTEELFRFACAIYDELNLKLSSGDEAAIFEEAYKSTFGEFPDNLDDLDDDGFD